MFSKNSIKLFFSILIISPMIMSSCSDEKKSESDNPNKEISADGTDGARSKYLNVNGEYFAIPSPFQISMLLKESKAPYSKNNLSTPGNLNRFSTTFLKAFNLGVYGADLGYVMMNDQSQDAIDYMASIKKLGDEIGISAAFDQTLMKRFEENVTNTDSILKLVSDAYQVSDDYLKNNQRNDLSAVVLTGGWIQSLYFGCKIALETQNHNLKKRVVQQKNTVESLVKLLFPHAAENEEIKELTLMMIELSEEFNQIEVTYKYIPPTTDKQKMTTVINSETSVNFTTEKLEKITSKIESIRNKFTS